MELKLNIYDDAMQNVVKVYTANTFRLKLGVVEDLMAIIDFDQFTDTDNVAISTAVLKLLPKCFPSIKELLKCVFAGVTDAELRNVSAMDIVLVIVNIIKYSIGEMSLLNTEKK